MSDIFDLKTFVFQYIFIKPFLFIIGIIDFLIGLIVPYKYEDPELPDKNALLAELTNKSDSKSAYRSTLTSDLVKIENVNSNIYEEFTNCVKKYWDKKTLGIREIVSIDDEIQPNGKVFKKFSLSNSYKWTTYEDVFHRVNNLSNGLLSLGLKSNDNIVLFAETRPEWLVSAFACFRIKVPVVTLYSTLGVDALTYGINQTKTSFLITSGEQLPKLQKILPKIPTVTHLIVIIDKFTQKNLLEFKKSSNQLKLFTIQEAEELGKETSPIAFKKPNINDLAVIMYTSGSTGNPKGVMISHGNVLTSLRALYTRLGTVRIEKDIYVAYLPLAHILELCIEVGCLINGIRVAYSSPQTISDTATAIKKGQKGDLRVLKPTIMAAVPVVLERLSKTVYEKLSKTTSFTQLLFKLAYESKLLSFRNGKSTRLLDRVLFKRISRAVVGKKLRLLVCGGAMLSKEVQEFVQVVLCPVMQAYGLTETCAGGTSQLPNQTDTGIVGSVVPCNEIRLVDWLEGGYRSTDTPYPRGEVYIGGDNVALGYYNMPEKTNEDFKIINGIRYFATGDIGEIINGNLKIIDRKKDLVKLQGGEYVSLNKVETILKLLSFVDNCCVVADPTKSNCVCLVCPNPKRITDLLSEPDEVTKTEVNNLKDINGVNEKSKELNRILEKNIKIVAQLSKEATSHCLSQGLERFEIPMKFKFVPEIWLPDTGFVTDSLKLKRKAIETYYKNDIEVLYK